MQAPGLGMVGQEIKHLEEVTLDMRTELNRRLGKQTRAEARCCDEYKKLAVDFNVQNTALHTKRKDRIFLLEKRRLAMAD